MTLTAICDCVYYIYSNNIGSSSASRQYLRYDEKKNKNNTWVKYNDTK